MKRSLSAAAFALVLTSSPAQACMGVQFESTVYPVMSDRPAPDAVPPGMNIYHVRYDGDRTGREDRLWPNFYVVEVLGGDLAGQKALIPAHVTSCQSVSMTEGDEGYVIADLRYELGQTKSDRPILSTGMTGRVVQSWPPTPEG